MNRIQQIVQGKPMIMISLLFIGYWVAYGFWKICQLVVSPFRRDEEINWPVHFVFSLGMLGSAYAMHIHLGPNNQNDAAEYFMEFCAVAGGIGGVLFVLSFLRHGLEKLADLI